jgi:predicted O-methyltransferase YrrM
MSQEIWNAVDDYVAPRLAKHDDALAGALTASTAAGLPEIAVSQLQGQMLHVLAKSVGALKVLEIGTLGGYSTIWLARALLDGGQVVTLELEPHHAEVARANLQKAGVDSMVDIRVGMAIETLSQLVAEGARPFDLVFIDADKPSGPDYFQWALKLTRPGSLIIVDNVVRNGELANAKSDDEKVLGCRRLIEMLQHEPHVTSTVVQTVGTKGHDGFAMAVVL